MPFGQFLLCHLTNFHYAIWPIFIMVFGQYYKCEVKIIFPYLLLSYLQTHCPPQGNVLDIKVSPFNLQALEEVIKMLKIEN